MITLSFFFFFQAEDGIRDLYVTGVQTCALPILLALTLTWGALLDPAESVAGLHGTLTGRTLDVRLAAAPVVAGVGIAATVVSLVWGLRERPMLLVVAWSALLVSSLLGFAVIPASLSSAGPDERAATDR